MNNEHTEVVGIFPIPIYFAMKEKLDEKTINFLNSSHIADEEDISIKAQYGSISVDTYILENNALRNLKKWIKFHIDEYTTNVLNWTTKVTITQSWISIKESNQEHILHKHPNSFISGVFYWEDDIEPLQFLRPEKNHNYEVARNLSSTGHNSFDYHSFKPRKNTLIIFPSELKHSVPSNSKNEIRRSLAFNTWVYETFGSIYNLTEVKF